MFIIFSYRKPRTVEQVRGGRANDGRFSTVKISSTAPLRLDFESHWDKLKKVLKEGPHVV